jgi:oxalate decarboxylase
MRISGVSSVCLFGCAAFTAALPSLNKRAAEFAQGEPIDATGKGGPILGIKRSYIQTRELLTVLGGTNKQLDLQNPDNLGQQPTDNGVVPNLKWSFSDSKTRLLNGGWVREQVVTDLPSSTDVAAAQQHLAKGAIRELHWHAVVCTFPNHRAPRVLIALG